MGKRKVILGLKVPSGFSLAERKMVIEEYLRTGCEKQALWMRYTGKKEEKGNILRWM